MDIVFDTQALLALYLDEEGSDRVESLLDDVTEGKIKGYMNVVNLAELYYILCRKSVQKADEKERNLRSFGVKVVEVSDGSLWREAAMLKARSRLSLADAFAAATAKTLGSKLVTGDDVEFTGIDGLRIERIKSRR